MPLPSSIVYFSDTLRLVFIFPQLGILFYYYQLALHFLSGPNARYLCKGMSSFPQLPASQPQLPFHHPGFVAPPPALTILNLELPISGTAHIWHCPYLRPQTSVSWFHGGLQLITPQRVAWASLVGVNTEPPTTTN